MRLNNYENENFEIHFPKIFNPSEPWELITVSVSIEINSGGEILPIVEGRYNLINVTYEYPTDSYGAIN